MKRFTATQNDEGARLSRFVQKLTRGLPEAALYRHFRKGRVKLNGKRAAAGDRLRAGDAVELYINDEFFWDGGKAPCPSPPRAAGEAPPYETVYEDGHIAVLYKPAGVLCHADERGAPSLLSAFTAVMAERGEHDPARENTFAPALCNRLDRGTEGLLLLAKTAAALREGGALLRGRMVRRIYLCVCAGAPPEGLHSAFLARDTGAKTVRVSAGSAAGAKPIATQVRVLEAAGPYCLCEAELITGRTHQIRAHLAQLGAPIAGDAKYNGGARLRGFGTQALCAWRLEFASPLPDGVLAGLAGRGFCAESARLPALWEQIKSRYS